MATRDPTMAGGKGNIFDLEGLDHWKMNPWACGLPPYIYADVVGINLFFWNLNEQA